MQKGKVRASLLALAIGLVWPAAPQAAESDQLFGMFMAEQLEYRVQKGRNLIYWDAEAWIGGDDNKLWFKTEGEKKRDDEFERAELHILYNRRINDFFDLQGGVRHDFRPGPSRTFGTIGLQGLAYYFIESDIAAFISNKGEFSARLTGEIDLPITQSLILQPKAELNLSAENVRERGIGRGVDSLELGLRLRYEIVPEFAPYIGVNWERRLGRSAEYARDEGERAGELSFVAGLRFWF